MADKIVGNLFPHPCGSEFANKVQNGADPRTVVPNDFLVVHGGKGSLPPLESQFSAATGPTLEYAAAAVPHGQIRVATAGAIRNCGGVVQWFAEVSRFNTINNQHVNIIESNRTSFSGVMPNPVPRRQRIDGDQV